MRGMQQHHRSHESGDEQEPAVNSDQRKAEKTGGGGLRLDGGFDAMRRLTLSSVRARTRSLSRAWTALMCESRRSMQVEGGVFVCRWFQR